MVPGHRDFPMPAGLIGSATAWLADPGREVPSARPSASVLLLREPAAGGGVELFVQHRASTMAFAPDVLAFPGGGVDPRDAELDPPWAGPAPLEWAHRLGVTQTLARQVVLAAARELFEECGVLLAARAPDADLVTGLRQRSWQQDRADLLSRRAALAEVLTRRGIVLRSDLLTLVGHWVTPVCEPRRYDTFFFAVRMPPGQVADGRTTEAVRTRWVTPATVLAEQAAGAEALLPPTQVLAEQWATVTGPVGDVLGRWPAVHAVQPWPVAHSDAVWMRAPVDEAGHGIPSRSVVDEQVGR